MHTYFTVSWARHLAGAWCHVNDKIRVPPKVQGPILKAA